MNEVDLMEMKQDIEDAKQKVSELKGERQALLKRLQEDWGCKTIEDAEKRIKDMENQIEDLSHEIETGMADLDDKIN